MRGSFNTISEICASRCRPDVYEEWYSSSNATVTNISNICSNLTQVFLVLVKLENMTRSFTHVADTDRHILGKMAWSLTSRYLVSVDCKTMTRSVADGLRTLRHSIWENCRVEFFRSIPDLGEIQNHETIISKHFVDTERHILRHNVAEFDREIPGLGEIQTHDDTFVCKRVADTERPILE